MGESGLDTETSFEQPFKHFESTENNLVLILHGPYIESYCLGLHESGVHAKNLALDNQIVKLARQTFQTLRPRLPYP